MPRKKQEETMESTLKEMAEALKDHGENNLAIVLYTYLGSKHLGMGSDFARHCQAYAKEGAKEIELHKNRGNN